MQGYFSAMQKTKHPKTIISKRDDILEVLNHLEDEFESKGISVFDYSVSQMRRDMLSAADELLIDLLAEEAKKTDSKAVVSDTPKQKATHYKRFLSKLVDFESLMSDPSQISAIKYDIIVKIREHIIQDLITKAQKYEFKGYLKKAREIYMDALFELKNDDIPDELQAHLINIVQDNLNRLEAEIGEG
ncbi:hypothetical protein [Oceanithermus profundus]|uniref:hypothetical protein n=1 Tax=Oceanithermus profundus TaxID=187137 RepID=UPI0011D2A85D|nr:hypothetical protein [Oceanithermus profundus]